MSHTPTTVNLAPISARDFATTLRVLRTLEEFQRVQHKNMPNIGLGYDTPFRSPITPAIAAVSHFSDWLPQLTAAPPHPKLSKGNRNTGRRQ